MNVSCGTRKYFFLAVNTGLVSEQLPDRRCRDFYAQRSGHGLYCSIVGNVVIPEGFGSNQNTAMISNSSAWGLLAKSIEAEGAVPGIQLATAWLGYRGMRNFVASSTNNEIAQYRAVAASYSTEEISNLFLALQHGTDLAVEAGFRHVQLHAAHGYLFSLVIDRRICALAYIALAAIDDWAYRLNKAGIETSLRFSLRTGDPSFDAAGNNEFLDTISSLSVSYLDVSSGFYNVNKRLIYPSLAPILLARRDETLALALRHRNARFILSGKSAHVPEASLPTNVDIGICRDLIANPNFLRDRDEGCINLMKCHYFSRGAPHLTCGRWGTGIRDAVTRPPFP